MNLYLFGGSFDPPHLGHYEIIKYFIKKSDIFIISPIFYSPLKKHKPKTSYLDRKKMIKLMLGVNYSRKISILDYEYENESIFSADTIRYLKENFNKFSINMIIGADQYNSIELWNEYEYILNNVNLIVISRPGIKIDMKKYPCELIEGITMDISSSDIQANILNTEKIKLQLGSKVFDYIANNNLYR